MIWIQLPIAGIFSKVKFLFVLKTKIFLSLIFVPSIKIENTPTYYQIIVCEIFIPIHCWMKKTKFWPDRNLPLYGTCTMITPPFLHAHCKQMECGLHMLNAKNVAASSNSVDFRVSKLKTNVICCTLPTAVLWKWLQTQWPCCVCKKASGVDVGHVQMILVLFMPRWGGGEAYTIPKLSAIKKVRGGSYMSGWGNSDGVLRYL